VRLNSSPLTFLVSVTRAVCLDMISEIVQLVEKLARDVLGDLPHLPVSVPLLIWKRRPTSSQIKFEGLPYIHDSPQCSIMSCHRILADFQGNLLWDVFLFNSTSWKLSVTSANRLLCGRILSALLRLLPFTNKVAPTSNSLQKAFIQS
jgi:hypothetical protein